MADGISRKSPTGNMDKDSDLRYVGKGNNNGDYVDAKNIQRVSQDGSVQGSVEPTLGNEFAFSLGSVSQQNKRFRITFDGDVTKQHELRFLSTQRDANMAVGTGTDGAVTFNGTQANFISQFNAAIAGSGVTFLLLTPTADTVEIELQGYNMYQWYMDSVGVDQVDFIVVREAIPVDLAGPLKDIGSYDLLGDLFIFSTTQDNEPTEIPAQIVGVGPVSGGLLVGPLTTLVFNAPHGLVQGQWIRIINSNAPWLNGVFVVQQVTSPTQIGIPTVLAWGGSRPLFTVGQEQVFVNPTGIGEIGVAQKDDNADAWTYTRLFRSVELNFVSTHIVIADGRTKNGRKILYFTDDYNGVRYISYGGEYVTDGLLNFVNDSNFISYGNVSFQVSITKRIFSEVIELSFVSQSDSGGQLTAGNKYYTFRLLDQLDNATPWSDLTGAIPVYSKGLSGQDPILIKGDEPAFVTSKANTLTVSGIPIGIFRSIEFGVVDIINEGSVSATRFLKLPLQQAASSATITHSGFENNQVPIDIGEFVVSFSPAEVVSKAKSLAIIDKRLVLGNLQYLDKSDLSEFSKTFLHSLRYRTTDGTGNIVGPSQTSKLFAGPISPNAVESEPSLVLLETYRVGVDYELVDGNVTDTFFVDDIKIDTSSVNSANPSDNRRISGLPDYILNEATYPYNIRIPEIVFEGLDPGYLINGLPISQLVSAIRFRFAKIEKEVLASGYVIMGVSGSMSTSPIGPSTIGVNQNSNQGTGVGTFPFPNFIDKWAVNPTNINPMLNELTLTGVSQYPMSFTPERSVCAFFSPEVSMGDMDDYQPLSADKLIVFYPLLPVSRTLVQDNFLSPIVNSNGSISTNGSNSSRGYGSVRGQYVIHPDITPSGNEQQNAINYRSINIEDAEIALPGGEAIIGGVDFKNYVMENSFGSAFFPFNQTGLSRYKLANAKCIAVKTVSDIYPADANPSSGSVNYWNNEVVDKGIYYAQIFREKPNKYGELSSTQYNSGSRRFNMADVQDTSTQIAVVGGDAFITTTYLRHRFNDNNASGFVIGGTIGGVTSVHETGRHIGMFYAAQSYKNMDLVYPDPAGLSPSFPEDYTGTYLNRLFRWTEDLQGEYVQFYNPAYSRWHSSLLYQAYFKDERISLDLPARIAYSVNDIYSSIDDSMIAFLPFNIHDLDTTWGEINAVSNLNGELFTIQDRKWQRQYFNSRGVLESSNNGVNVLLGAGNVMSRDGESVSFYGAFHQLSCVKGRSSGGKDSFYWFNSENGLFMRFGGDGTVVISDVNRLRSFANKAAKWLRGKDTPAFDQGIRSVWDDRSKEVIWTFTGWREIEQSWQNGAFVEVGEVVTNTNAPYDTYEELPRFFKCILVHTSTPPSEPGVGNDWQTYWQQIPYDDFNYYSVFTIAYNELSNGFSTFYSHIPKTYLKWRGIFLSSHPINRNLIFEHRRGEPTTWYGVDSFLTGTIPPKIEDAEIEMVVNDTPEQSIRGVAVGYLSDRSPDRIDYVTKSQRTYSEAVDFEQRDDQFYAPIRGDVSQGDAPDDAETLLSGDYMKVKFTIFGGTYNLLHSIIVKFRNRLRRINT